MSSNRSHDLLRTNNGAGIIRHIDVESGLHLCIRVIRRRIPYHRHFVALEIPPSCFEELAAQAEVLERHFLYQAKIQTYYPFRDEDDFALPRTIEACEQQIRMSLEAAKAFREKYRGELPAHIGYQQLAIIREKQGNFESAINISQKACDEGWVGDWKNRIERCKKKVAKQATGLAPFSWRGSVLGQCN